MFVDDPKALFLLKSWGQGDGVLPLVRHLISIGRDDEAAVIARLALRTADGDERVALRALLDECTHVPAGWADAIEAFAADPSDEAWDALLRFTPDEERFQRVKAMVLVLMQLGCDGNVLFRCASKIGFFPELFDLAQSGTVDPELIEARANGSPSEPAWLGLAAHAALARNDRFAVVRYLRKAQQHEAAALSWAAVMEIRALADDALNEELDRVGVRRFGGEKEE